MVRFRRFGSILTNYHHVHFLAIDPRWLRDRVKSNPDLGGGGRILGVIYWGGDEHARFESQRTTKTKRALTLRVARGSGVVDCPEHAPNN